MVTEILLKKTKLLVIDPSKGNHSVWKYLPFELEGHVFMEGNKNFSVQNPVALIYIQVTIS